MVESPHGLVYLLDADAGVRDGLRSMLRSHGYNVECYGSAEQFLAAPIDQTHACIVSEFKLPDLNGVELIERLRRNSRGLPIIVMAARGSVATAVDAMRAGAIDFLEKPFSQRQLLDRIAEVLANINV